jgi:hypothetical protein
MEGWLKAGVGFPMIGISFPRLGKTEAKSSDVLKTG